MLPLTLNTLNRLLNILATYKENSPAITQHRENYLYKAMRVPITLPEDQSFTIVSDTIVASNEPISLIKLINKQLIPLNTAAVEELTRKIGDILFEDDSASLINPETNDICNITRSTKDPGYWHYTYFYQDGTHNDILSLERDIKLLDAVKAGYCQVIPRDQVIEMVLDNHRAA